MPMAKASLPAGKRPAREVLDFPLLDGGKAREMGLGSLAALSLADARVAAAKCRSQRQAGTDPIAARDAEREKTALGRR